MRKLVLALAAVAVMLVAAPAEASQRPEIIRVPAEGMTFYNPCTDELLTVVRGTFQTIFHFTEDADGGQHVFADTTAQDVEAVGTSGRYRIVGGDTQEINRTSDGATTDTVVTVFSVVSQTSTENLTVIFISHVTFNANGRLTAFTDVLADGVCRG